MTISQERIQWAKDEISGWASAVVQEFCVYPSESAAIYADLDAVLALIDELVVARKEEV